MSSPRLTALGDLAILAPASLMVPPLILTVTATLILWAGAAADARAYPHAMGADRPASSGPTTGGS